MLLALLSCLPLLALFGCSSPVAPVELAGTIEKASLTPAELLAWSVTPDIRSVVNGIEVRGRLHIGGCGGRPLLRASRRGQTIQVIVERELFPILCVTAGGYEALLTPYRARLAVTPGHRYDVSVRARSVVGFLRASAAVYVEP